MTISVKKTLLFTTLAITLSATGGSRRLDPEAQRVQELHESLDNSNYDWLTFDQRKELQDILDSNSATPEANIADFEARLSRFRSNYKRNETKKDLRDMLNTRAYDWLTNAEKLELQEVLDRSSSDPKVDIQGFKDRLAQFREKHGISRTIAGLQEDLQHSRYAWLTRQQKRELKDLLNPESSSPEQDLAEFNNRLSQFRLKYELEQKKKALSDSLDRGRYSGLTRAQKKELRASLYRNSETPEDDILEFKNKLVQFGYDMPA